MNRNAAFFKSVKKFYTIMSNSFTVQRIQTFGVTDRRMPQGRTKENATTLTAIAFPIER